MDARSRRLVRYSNIHTWEQVVSPYTTCTFCEQQCYTSFVRNLDGTTTPRTDEAGMRPSVCQSQVNILARCEPADGAFIAGSRVQSEHNTAEVQRNCWFSIPHSNMQ